MNRSINVLKGIGIFAVVLGHVIIGLQEEHFLRFFIYSFHMPLFFFISGFLSDPVKCSKLSLFSFLMKYTKRMFLWWFLAWLIYTPLSVSLPQTFSFFQVSKWTIIHLLWPWYHLWFVPGLFIVLLFQYLFVRFTKCSADTVALIMLVLGFVLFLLFPTPFYPILQTYNFLMFSIGYLCKNNGINSLVVNPFAGVLIYICLITLIYYIAPIPRGIYILPVLIGLFVFVIRPVVNKDFLRCNLLEYLGKHSLHIYLWHVLPIIVCKYYFKDNLPIYYLTTIFLMFFLLILIPICILRIEQLRK